jgi:8-amino-7-oxononanoate synthase
MSSSLPSLDRFASDKLAALDAAALRRRLRETDRTDPVRVQRDGKTLLSFCCNDYLGLSQHPAVKVAAIDAIARYGVGAAASRLVTGNHPLFAGLESRLAALKGTDDACVFGSGYLANIGIIPTFAGPGDLILIDELAHACIWAGAKLSGAKVISFRHNDVEHASEFLQSSRAAFRHSLICTDGVFSMDGDLAPLPDLAAVAERYDAWLMTDDAHGIGVVGGGRGSSFAFGDKVPVPLQMGTLSKGVGGYGGYLCASQPVIDLVRTRARSFIYSTGLPPASVAAASVALDLIRDHPDLCARPVNLARRFTAALGLPQAESPIVPILLGEATAALQASDRLLQHGFLVTAIRPPTVPAGTARLRLTFSALHDEADVDRLATVISNEILRS